MGGYAYAADAATDGGAASRAVERRAFAKVLGTLGEARAVGVHGPIAVQAAFEVRMLWAALIRDLGSETNALSADLRAQLISIGMRMLDCAERLREGEFETVGEITEVCEIIAVGLEE